MKYVVMALAVFLWLSSIARADEMLLDCLQDAELDEEEQDVNKGGGQDIMIGATWGEPELWRAYGLFEFEDTIMTLPQYYMAVNEAILTLYIVSNDNDAEVEFFSAAEEWDEASVTWDSRPLENRDIVVIDTAPPLEPPAQVWEVDVTEIVRTWYGFSPVEAFGLYVGVPDNGVVVDIDVVSRDHPDTSLHPRLWIDFHTVHVSEKRSADAIRFKVSTVSANRAEIYFCVPYSTIALLEVYDVCGALVETVVDGQVESGNHRFTWSGEPGVYYVRMMVEGGAIVRRTIILN